MKDERILEILSKYNISRTSLEVGQKIGFNKIISLNQKNELFPTYREECRQWLRDNPEIKDDMKKVCPFYPLIFEGNNDDEIIDMLIEEIPFTIMLEIMEQNGYKRAPALLNAVIEVASNDIDAWRLEECTMLGVGLDYLREILEYLYFSELLPTTNRIGFL